MKVVVARYNEDISWLKEVKHEICLYNKGDSISVEDFSNVEYFSLPNNGREGETYLTFILNNYSSLPDHITFCQGNPFDHCDNIVSLINNFDSQSDFTYLSHWIHTEYPNGEGEFYHEQKGILNTLPLLGIDWEIGPVVFGTGAQFIVSSSLILNKPYEWWENCYNVYNNNPRSPWIFERIWKYIFV
jgi:hypothetical protein